MVQTATALAEAATAPRPAAAATATAPAAASAESAAAAATTPAPAAAATTPAATTPAATAAATTMSAAAPGQLDARLRGVVLFVEDVERAQADVGELLLAEDHLVVGQKIWRGRHIGGRRSDRSRRATGE